MHKQLVIGVVTALALVAIAFLGFYKALAASTAPWINSPLFINRQSDAAALPSTASHQGNIDCLNQTGNECQVATDYGIATNGSKVSFGDKFEPIVTYVDNREHFFPVPNSNSAISVYNGGAVYGLNLAFNRNFTSSITKEGNIITGYKYRINRPPDAKLTDKSNRLLPADTLSIGFSQNGRWMVLSSPNLAMLRVDLQTFDVLPFAPGFNYTIGLDPDVRTAISNDGRYAVTASYNFNTFKLYDLNTCAAVPNTILGPVACQSRDLKAALQNTAPSYARTLSARFMNNDSLAVYGAYQTSDNASKIARYIISDQSSAGQLDYLALGDSYISGEGAFDYLPETDTASNQCHISLLAYPYLLGKDLDYNSYHSVACSGATSHDIIDTGLDYKGQADQQQITRFQRDLNGEVGSILNSFSAGYIDQLDFVSAYQPQAATVSVGGNDMGFSQILYQCIAPWNLSTCYDTYEDRLELVRMINTKVFNNLVNTYSMLKSAGSPTMRLYAVGYPQIAKAGGYCGLNVRLNSDEVLFSQELIDYLDQVVKAAAARTGVYYVDTEDALYGFRLCEADRGTIAMNGLTAGNDFPEIFGGPIGRESYHPNAKGYQLLENKILSATDNLTAIMPAADPAAAPPAYSGLPILDVRHSGRAVKAAEYDPGIGPDLAYQQVPINITIRGSSHILPAATSLTAELHSDVIHLGNYSTDQNGDLTAQVNIPATAPTGYHSIHFYGTDITGQPIDIYKYIYVAKTPQDMDGDGVQDSTQKCVGIGPADVDYDQDGIDDACDADITFPPAADNGPGENSTPTLPAASQILSSKTSQDTGQNSLFTPVTLSESYDLPLGIADNDVYKIFSGDSPTNKLADNGPNFRTATDELSGNQSGQENILLGLGLILAGVLGLIFRRRV